MEEETPAPKPAAVAVCSTIRMGKTTETAASASLPSHDTNSASAVRKVMRATASPMLGAASRSRVERMGASSRSRVRGGKTAVIDMP
jgi:hypothetical protein